MSITTGNYIIDHLLQITKDVDIEFDCFSLDFQWHEMSSSEHLFNNFESDLVTVN